MDSVILHIFQILSKSAIGYIVLGAGIGIAAVVVLFIFAWRYSRKHWETIQDMHLKITSMEAQSTGRMSFADTITDHDRRICLAEQALTNTGDDVREIKTDVKQIFRILDSRHTDMPMNIDRRRNET